MASDRGGDRRVLGGLVTGALGAVATTAVIAAFGRAQQGSAWTPFNDIAHMIYGDRPVNPDGFVPRETLAGLGLNASAVVTWGALYDMVAGKVAFPQSLLAGAAATGLVYLLDYHVFPERLKPNFEKRLGPGAVLAAYAALGLVLGLSPLWTRRSPDVRAPGGSE
jgi:hypothetical protein